MFPLFYSIAISRTWKRWLSTFVRDKTWPYKQVDSDGKNSLRKTAWKSFIFPDNIHRICAKTVAANWKIEKQSIHLSILWILIVNSNYIFISISLFITFETRKKFHYFLICDGGCIVHRALEKTSIALLIDFHIQNPLTTFDFIDKIERKIDLLHFIDKNSTSIVPTHW